MISDLFSFKARACANFALVKYWGKRDAALNLPMHSSFSLSASALESEAAVVWGDFERDELRVNGDIADHAAITRAARIFDEVRSYFGVSYKCRADSRNFFPTAAGLASSASAFAALSKACYGALSFLGDVDAKRLSRTARLGSGSACRSVERGWVEWSKGVRDDGEDSYAVQCYAPDYWELCWVIALVDEKQKKILSTASMENVVKTGIFYDAFSKSCEDDLNMLKLAVKEKDFEALTSVCERNCMRMHATCLSASTPFFYFRPGTLKVLEMLQELRAQSVSFAFTIDAGANVKMLCEPSQVRELVCVLESIGIAHIISPI